MNNSEWFVRPRPQPQTEARMRLLCFPYAGGGVSLFHKWPALVAPQIELWAANLPGRGARLQEPVCTRLKPLIAALTDAIVPLTQRPFVFFGHSFGARIAFDLTQTLRNLGLPLPKQLFLSACPAPQLPDRSLTLHTMPQEMLLAELDKRGGVPASVLAQSAVLDALMPALRADLTVLETAVYQPQAAVDIPITVFGGTVDSVVTPLELDAWHMHTTCDFRRQMFVGGHFFLETAVADLTRTIKYELENL